MAEFRPGTPEQSEFLAELVDAGFLVESGVSGIYGRDEAFERIRRGFDDRVSEASAAAPRAWPRTNVSTVTAAWSACSPVNPAAS